MREIKIFSTIIRVFEEILILKELLNVAKITQFFRILPKQKGGIIPMWGKGEGLIINT